jgi:hypothetical protein
MGTGQRKHDPILRSRVNPVLPMALQEFGNSIECVFLRRYDRQTASESFNPFVLEFTLAGMRIDRKTRRRSI